jgi:regulator of sigma E protease
MEWLLSVMTSVAAGLAMIGVLVVIHEFGHFIVAKLFGIGVPVFSVGMGPRLFGFEYNGTDYRLSALPIGGYVRMCGADPFGEEDPGETVDPDLDFMNKPVWQRLLVMLAGPAFNLGLPFVLFTAVLMLGEPQADTSIGLVIPGSRAEEAGLEVGDSIVRVDGTKVDVWGDLVLMLTKVAHKPSVPIRVLRDGKSVDLVLPGEAVQLADDGIIDLEVLGMWSSRLSTRIGIDSPDSPAARAGLRTGDAIMTVDGHDVADWESLHARLSPGRSHELTYIRADDSQIDSRSTTLEPGEWAVLSNDPVQDSWGFVPTVLFVGSVRPDSPAEAAGVLADDRILAIDGQYVRTWSELVALIKSTSKHLTAEDVPRALALSIVRDGQRRELEFRPEMTREVVRGRAKYRPLIGIQIYPNAYVSGPDVKKYYGPLEAANRATEEGIIVFKHTIGVLTNLIVGELRPQESLGGPIEIFRLAGEGARQGIFTYARLVGTISFSLGIINLLPVPVLDGGHICFYLIEAVRGRPVSLVLRERIQMVGVLALVALMLMVTVMDVNRWLSG